MNEKRIGDIIIALKFVVNQDTFNVISTYIPQVGLAKYHKIKFWEDFEDLLHDILQREKFLGSGLNGHVGSLAKGFKGVHVCYALGW